MATLQEQCRKLLRVPIRVLRIWIDQDRTDGASAAALVNEIRRLCETHLDGTTCADDVQWVFGYIDECRKAYRGGAKFSGDGDIESVSDTRSHNNDGRGDVCETNRLIELTDRAVRRFASSEQHKRYRSFRQCGAKASTTQSRSFDVSRAVMHESIEKARHIGLAGALLLAGEETDGRFDSLLFSEDFARTTPFTLRVFAAFEGILANHRVKLKRGQSRLAAGFSRLWERGNRMLHALLSHGPQTDAVTQIIHTACFVQTLAARWGGPRFGTQYAETWSLLRKSGALECRALRQLYANIGSYCGMPEHQLRHLECPAASRQEFSGLYSFVRGVTQPGRPVLTRRFLSQPETLLEQYTAEPDAGFCAKLVDVMVRYLHNSLNHNDGSMRKILAWVETWATLLIEHLLPVDKKRIEKLAGALEQYRGQLCSTSDYGRIWVRAMWNLSRAA